MELKSAVIVMDMLNDFVTGELRCERAERIIPALQRILEAARQVGVPVVYANDAHLPVDVELAIWGQHAMAGTPGARVIPQLEPQPGDFQIPKRTYSAFHGTGLDSLLRGLDADSVLITGVHTHICGLHTAADAFYRGFGVKVVSDATEAFTDDDRDNSLAYLQKVYGAELISSHDLLEQWKGASA